MIYCYECGEKVAENDIFCPFCGISLPPMSVGGEVEDDSMSKTIAIDKPASENAEKSDEVKPAEASFAENEAALNSSISQTSGKIADQKTDAFTKGKTEENFDVKTESVNVPAEVLQTAAPAKDVSDEELKKMETLFADEADDTDWSENLSGKPEKIENQASEQQKVLKTVNPLVQNFTATPESSKIESSANESVEKSVTESDLMSYDETPVKEILSADEPEKAFDEDASKVEDDFSSAPLKEIAPSDLIADRSSAFAEAPIAMPEMELPEAETPPPSRFDSVSIMEKKEPSEDFAPAAKTPAESFPAAQKFSESQEERSFTKPNIGTSDTGGKGKAKLKPLDEGTVLNGRYEIVRKIGGGGMGAVYLASDKNLGGVLRAVKEMVQSYIEDAQQEKAVNDFKRESLLLTSLDHPAIPTIYDYFYDEKEERFYLVMKYISGGDLAARLRSAPENRIDEAEVAKWSLQIADVLDYLHNRQPPIVYRDLKPANIMIDGNSGRVMLIDFGIARWVNKEEKGVTAVGTMGYAPPELFSGNVESRSDIYSLGSTMFHLLTGADPQSNPLLIFDFQKHPRPRQINSQLSDQMERILMRAVEYSADKRFESAAAMRKSLDEYVEAQKTGRLTYGIKEAPSPAALSDQPVFCGFCGQKIVATDMFCAFCGAKQPLAQQGVHSESYSPVPLTAQLLVIGTSELELPAFRLEKETNLVGRRDPQSNIFPEVDLSKYDPQTKISRRHARIWREGSEFMVEDLGSSNGTYILPVVADTRRLQPHQPQLLTNGDKIRLGDTTLHFVLG